MKLEEQLNAIKNDDKMNCYLWQDTFGTATIDQLMEAMEQYSNHDCKMMHGEIIVYNEDGTDWTYAVITSDLTDDAKERFRQSFARSMPRGYSLEEDMKLLYPLCEPWKNMNFGNNRNPDWNKNRCCTPERMGRNWALKVCDGWEFYMERHRND